MDRVVARVSCQDIVGKGKKAHSSRGLKIYRSKEVNRQHRYYTEHVIERPDAQTPTYIEFLRTDCAGAMKFLGQELDEQKSRQGEEEVNSDPPKCMNEIDGGLMGRRSMMDEDQQKSNKTQSV